MSSFSNLAGPLGRAVTKVVQSLMSSPGRNPSGVAGPAVLDRPTQGRRPQGSQSGQGAQRSQGAPGRQAVVPYPGDFTGKVSQLDLRYNPTHDARADAGEVVWAWVPFEEDHSKGKDRPVLVIGHDGTCLLALQLTSKDHDRDAAQEARAGRHWMDVGSGPWDRQGRPSEVRLDRVLRLDPQAVRRDGAAIGESVFAAVAQAVRQGC